ncbi:MAG: hypothetical protein K2X93_07225 [Candidatus Obscuribacterales bacterium]|nr:hypothetical protein [Candidatus Obscuribacterales bacterium]
MESETSLDNSTSSTTFQVGQIVFEKFEVEGVLGFGNARQSRRKLRREKIENLVDTIYGTEHGGTK